ncbi:hypothetical protein LTSEWAN_1585 [Salmonella enterica subsp. enterica serovar Wandsworth str. A4-580]|uniref:Uncharacterized protein n=1 Tax=Salmonella enterica subsp. enterica serovar Wandsworth str. A4-580 TaxID=913086 RepID=G5S9E0_SALET|nr:hypothetical protein LTSEWAN_1585 [Salmonella enterica subsp. enterica serovar Wandsworth str. A4-580]
MESTASIPHLVGQEKHFYLENDNLYSQYLYMSNQNNMLTVKQNK